MQSHSLQILKLKLFAIVPYPIPRVDSFSDPLLCFRRLSGSLPGPETTHTAIQACFSTGYCRREAIRVEMLHMVTLFAALSALTYGSADFIGGLATRRSPVTSVVAWSQAVGIPVALIAAPFIGGTVLSGGDWLWGAAAGLSGALGLGLLYQGLATGLAAVVSPAAALTGAALPVLFGVIFGERPELVAWIGIAMALPATVLLSLERGDNKGQVLRSLQMGMLAGCGFGGFFILLAQTAGDSGLWPLVAARTASVPLLFIITAARRRPLYLSRGSLILTLSAGALDMAANVFYLLAFRSGMLITAAVITALYPAPTVILQRLFIREKLGILRIIGLILAIAGIALIGLG